MGWVLNDTPWPLYPQETDPVPILQEAVWAPGPVRTGGKNLTPTRIRYPDHPPRIHTDYAIQAHYIKQVIKKEEWSLEMNKFMWLHELPPWFRLNVRR